MCNGSSSMIDSHFSKQTKKREDMEKEKTGKSEKKGQKEKKIN